MSIGPLSRRLVRLRSAVQSERGRRVMRMVRAAFIGAVLAWLVYQLSAIGWAEVWASRPRTPWFYLIWLALYAQLPLIEAFIFRSLWGLPLAQGLPLVLGKRALNQDVVSYAGEAYFFAAARRRLAHSDRYLLGTLKDNALASAAASTSAAVLLLVLFLFTGQIVLADLIGDHYLLYVGGGLALAAVVAGLAAHFRRRLFTAPPRLVLGLFATHLLRFFLLIYVLQILQWWVVLPEAPFQVWATMLAVVTVVNRLPLIPARDLVGIGVVLGMTGLLEASASVITAMLLTRSVLDKSANFALFGLAQLLKRRRPAAPGPPPERAAAPELQHAD